MKSDRFVLPRTPALDGIRGLAILGVLAVHIPLSFIRGGFLGVEVFFVLSGFLITSLLLKEFDDTGRIAFKAFYMRRVLRLAPALLITIAAVSVFVVTCSPAELDNTLHDMAVTLLYITNWSHAFFLTRHPYFDQAWSLAIEEQFYIFFPALLYRLLRTLNRVSVTILVASLALLSWLWRAFLIGQDVGFARIHHGTDTRLDGLLLGCVLALLLSTPAYGYLWARAQRYRQTADLAALAAFVGLLLILWQAELMQALTYYAVLPLLQVFTCVLIWHVVTVDRSALKTLFSWGPLVWLGKISYGVYLYHWIAIFMLMRLFPDWQGVTTHGVVGVSIGIVAASSSYRYIETPILRHKTKYRAQDHSAKG